MRIIQSTEELKQLAGQEVAAGEWIEVTQEMINRFADVTGDHQWIHVDAGRAARESPFGKTIAHGFLTLSLLSEMSRQAMEWRGDYKLRINYGMNRLRFPAPVPSGSKIRARFTLQSVEEFDWGVQTVWAATVEIEGGSKPAMVAEWVTRAYR